MASNNNNNNKLTGCNTASVLSALESCSHFDAAVRQPAEQALQNWEKALPGYLSHLLSILGDNNISGRADVRLLAAILIRNAVPSVWCFSRRHEMQLRGSNITRDMETEQQQQKEQEILTEQNKQEKVHVRNTLPNIYFSEAIDEKIAVYLRLAIGAISCFDFPLEWPTLLQDLLQVAAASNSGGMRQNRALQLVREVLISARNRRIIIDPKQKSGKSRFVNISDIMREAALSKKQGQVSAAGAVGALTLGVAQHAASFLNMADELNGLLCVGYIKAVTELYRLIGMSRLPELESFGSDSRNFFTQAALLLEKTSFYAISYPAATAQRQAQQQSSGYTSNEQWTRFGDKIYRHVLNCLMTVVSTLPRESAPIVPKCIEVVLKDIIGLDEAALRTLPLKRLVAQTMFLRDVLRQPAYYDSDLVNQQQHAVQSLLSRLTGQSAGSITLFDPHQLLQQQNNDSQKDDPDLENAKQAVAQMTKSVSELNGNHVIIVDNINTPIISVEALTQAIVIKFLRLSPNEMAEWKDDPEGRFETDEAERTPDNEVNRPRHCGGMVLMEMMRRNPINVGRTLIDLAKQCQQVPIQDITGLLHREACYRALQFCKFNILDKASDLNFDFSIWWSGELLALLQMHFTIDQPIPMRMLQARAIQILQVYSQALKNEQDYTTAFVAVSHLLAAPDLVVALCAARCVSHLALLHFKPTEVTPHLQKVRENSIVPLGNAFALANRVVGQECLRTVLLLVSSLVEANGTCLEGNILNAIAEQLPPLWNRASDSVAIHSCLVSVLSHLVGKLGSIAIENLHIQKVLFPLIDYCTDISSGMLRTDTLLEDGLRLWLVTLVTSRMAIMGNYLSTMLPRLEVILKTGLEAHLSLKVLHLYVVLVGPTVLQPLVGNLQSLLMDCVSCILKEGKDGGVKVSDEEMMSDTISLTEESNNKDQEKSTKAGLMKDGIGALHFCSDILLLYPAFGYEIGQGAIITVLQAIIASRKSRAENLKENIPHSLVEAVFVAFGNLILFRPTLLEELFADNPDEDAQILSLVTTWIQVISNPPMQYIMIMSSSVVLLFIDKKRLALSLCAAVCKGHKTRRLVGSTVLRYTKTLIDTELESKIKVDDLVRVSCGTTRQVIGDGPLGDTATRTAEILKSDPVLTTKLVNVYEQVSKLLREQQQPASPAHIMS